MEAVAGLTWALPSSCLDLKKQTVVSIPTHLVLKGLPCPLNGRMVSQVLTPETTSVLGELGCDLVCREGGSVDLPSGDMGEESPS